jgi:tetrahydromethanopterin S-methyltransferase subunit H
MKDWFTEDEDDIFMGSPKSKFFDISKQANSEIVEDEMDKIIERYAAMELMLSQGQGEDFDINRQIAQFIFENADEVTRMKKGLYVEFTGEIICRLDS